MAALTLLLPVRNESALIGDALQALPPQRPDLEVLVIDDHSADGTAEIAAHHANVILSPGRGRGAALDAGAQAARGDILFFVHADTRFPSDALEAIQDALKDPAIMGGTFDRRFDNPSLRFRLLNHMVRTIGALSGTMLGDQGIFCRKADFLAVGGCKGLPLFEDVDLSRRLRKRGEIVRLPQVATLSARRYEKKGILKATTLNYALTALYFLGVSPQKLWELYYGRPWEG